MDALITSRDPDISEVYSDVKDRQQFRCLAHPAKPEMDLDDQKPSYHNIIVRVEACNHGLP